MVLDVCSPTPQNKPLFQLHPSPQTFFTILCDILFPSHTDTSLTLLLSLLGLFNCMGQALVGIAELA